MQIPIVDENDKLICYKERRQVKKEEIYRVSALWITNKEGDILLARRALTKKHDPGKWGPAVAGTVEKDETYKVNIVKESEEELGLKNIKPKTGPKLRIRGLHHYFAQWYFLTIPKETKIIFDKREVGEVKWFKKKELQRESQEHPDQFLKNMYLDVETFK